MGGWTFSEPNPIISYAVGIEFEQALPAATLRLLSARHSEFRRELPRRVEQQALTFQFGGAPVTQPQPEVSGVVFDSVKSDGSIGRALSVVQKVASYMIADYTRWIEFWPQAERLLRPVAELALDARIRVTALILMASNRFVWGPEQGPPNFGLVIRRGSDLVAPHMLECEGPAHSFHGYYKTHPEPKGQRLDNIMISSTGPAPETRLDVNLSFRLVLTDPAGDIESLFVASDFGDRPLLEQGLESLHQLNNRLFCDIVAGPMVKGIPGLSVRC